MYYIYEIPGVKIGCTSNFKRRQKNQRYKGEMVLLEKYTNIQKASQRELQLQREKGYDVDDRSYLDMVKMAPIGNQAANNPTSMAKMVSKKDYVEESRRQMKAVEQYTLDGKFIQRFRGIGEAARAIGTNRSGIQATVRGRQTKAYGYTWKYAIVKERL